MSPQDKVACLETRKKFLGYYDWSLLSWENRLYHILSTKWCGNEVPPLDHETLYVDDPHGCKYVFSFLNDSFEIGIGYPSQWNTILRRETIHKFIRWYLFKYVFIEWLGIRRWLWYKLLHRSVCRSKNHLG